MRHHGGSLKIISALVSLLMLGVFGAPACFAFPSDIPENTPLTTEQELVKWYKSDVVVGSLSVTVEISKEIRLNSVGKKQLSSINGGLQVKRGGVLTLDNPELTIQKSKPYVAPITVESGGTLIIAQSFIYASWTQSGPSIVVKSGGKLDGAELLPQYIVVQYDDDEPIDPPPEPPINPPPTDDRKPISSTLDEDFRLSCVAGERPNLGAYPASAHVEVLGLDEAPLLPLVWDTSNVEFDAAGTYSAIGKFTQAGLDAFKLSNPKSLTVDMAITVYEKTPIDSLQGWLIEANPSGNTLIKLTLPALPPGEVTAVYIYRSSDNVSWKQQTWSGQPGTGVSEQETNFLSLVRTEGESSEIPYRYPTDGQTIWLRAEIVGSALAGISNSICLETANLQPEEPPSGGKNSSGSQGGGGQSEGKRILRDRSEDTSKSTILAAQNWEDRTEATNSARATTTAPPNAAVQAAYPALAAQVVNPQLAESVEAAPKGVVEAVALPGETSSATIPTEREQEKSTPPIGAAAVSLIGGGGLIGWLYLKKKP